MSLMRRRKVEGWALCHDCDRWFYCPGWFDRRAPEPTFQVCGAEPAAMVNQARCSPAEAADVRAGVHADAS